MMYKIIETDSYQILETQTGQIVAKYENSDTANSICRNLNYGGGFDGFSPSFFLKDFKVNV